MQLIVESVHFSNKNVAKLYENNPRYFGVLHLIKIKNVAMLDCP